LKQILEKKTVRRNYLILNFEQLVYLDTSEATCWSTFSARPSQDCSNRCQ